MELVKRIRKFILTTMFLYLEDPRFSWWNITAEQVSGKFMRDTVLQSGNHSKYCQLSDVKKSFNRKASSKKIDN